MTLDEFMVKWKAHDAEVRLRGGEPTEEQMLIALGPRRETFAYGGTIRLCRNCNRPVFGGPTLCVECGT